MLFLLASRGCAYRKLVGCIQCGNWLRKISRFKFASKKIKSLRFHIVVPRLDVLDLVGDLPEARWSCGSMQVIVPVNSSLAQEAVKGLHALLVIGGALLVEPIA